MNVLQVITYSYKYMHMFQDMECINLYLDSILIHYISSLGMNTLIYRQYTGMSVTTLQNRRF